MSHSPSLHCHSGGHAQWAAIELASPLFVGIYAMAAWMVWHGGWKYSGLLCYLPSAGWELITWLIVHDKQPAWQ